MENIKFNTINNKLDELDDIKKTETPQASGKLIDDSIKGHKTINEIKQEPKATKKPKTALVQYIGSGIWVDAKGEHWAINDVPNTFIKSDRQYNIDEYEAREDIKFMVGYGQMKVSFV